MKTAFGEIQDNLKNHSSKLEKYTSEEQIRDLHERTQVGLERLQEILYSYRYLIMDELQSGNIFRFGHIAKIKPVGMTEVKPEKTLASFASDIATITNTPAHVVSGVLEYYIKLTELNLRQGKSFNLVGILKLKPALDEWGTVQNIKAELSDSVNPLMSNNNYKLRVKVLNNIRYLVVNSQKAG